MTEWDKQTDVRNGFFRAWWEFPHITTHDAHHAVHDRHIFFLITHIACATRCI